MQQATGRVYLVGAGPGDPGLITLKGLRALESAQVVVYDRLVDRRLLQHAPQQATLIDVGKGRGEHRLTQEGINVLLVQEAQQGRTVVRLKGGDPFLFGRGGEEAEALAHAGVPFEIVPGVTSAIAVPAYAGIPVTHRNVASSLAVVTGSEDPSREGSRIDWSAMARADTLVVLMGMESLASIVSSLLAEGRTPETPVALIRWGTDPYQQTVTGTLQDILQRARDAGLQPPVVAVVGEVVRLRERLRWFDCKPLFGKRVLVTRARHQASALSELLAAEGAWPVEVPVLRIEPVRDTGPLDEALKALGTYDWAVFTSSNAVELAFQRLHALGLDARAFGPARVCAIGPGTARALEERGIVSDLIPKEYIAESVLEALRLRLRPGARVLLPRAEGAREVLSRGLEALGAQVHQVPLYRSVVPQESRAAAQEAFKQGVDAVAFTSSSTVRGLLDLLDGDPRPLQNCAIACIGPVTAATARKLGLEVSVTADEHTVPGLVSALVRYYQGER